MAEQMPAEQPPAATVDWPEQAADEIIKRVGQVRDKTTGPALKVARGVVYGFAIAFIGITLLIVLAIVLVRVLDIALENAITGDDHTWLAHTVIGLLFLGGGLIAWSKRTTSS